MRKRIRKLEDDGVIKKYTIEIDPRKAGFEISAQVGIDTKPEKYIEVLENLKRMKSVSCMKTSSGDHMIIIECLFARDSSQLADFVRKIESMEGVTRVCPSVITEKIK